MTSPSLVADPLRNIRPYLFSPYFLFYLPRSHSVSLPHSLSPLNRVNARSRASNVRVSVSIFYRFSPVPADFSSHFPPWLCTHPAQCCSPGGGSSSTSRSIVQRLLPQRILELLRLSRVERSCTTRPTNCRTLQCSPAQQPTTALIRRRGRDGDVA